MEKEDWVPFSFFDEVHCVPVNVNELTLERKLSRNRHIGHQFSSLFLIYNVFCRKYELYGKREVSRPGMIRSAFL